eukprot:8138582-Prorocentrum_lima.AAC.1
MANTSALQRQAEQQHTEEQQVNKEPVQYKAFLLSAGPEELSQPRPQNSWQLVLRKGAGKD